MLKEMLLEICAENEIQIDELSLGWVFRLTKGEKTRYIAGHHFDGNAAAADRIACDKYACYTLLMQSGIPAVVHEIVFDPITRSGWMGPAGAWHKAQEIYKRFGEKVVIKPNDGWQGRDVTLCETFTQAEKALSDIFRQYTNACICPFYDIQYEYRVFYAYGNCPFAYGKERSQHSWKHNLSGGAKAFDIHDAVLLSQLQTLARQAASAINISFATVDIAQLADERLIVMEINAGVAARKLLEQHPRHKDKIKSLYVEAISKMFE